VFFIYTVTWLHIIIATPYPYQWLYEAKEAKHVPIQIIQQAQYMQEQAIKKQTFNNYKSNWTQWVKFCNSYKIPIVPVTEIGLLLYAAHRITKIQAQSIKTQFTGIKSIARAYGHPINTNEMQYVQQLTKSINKRFTHKNSKGRGAFTFELCEASHSYFNLRNYDELVKYTAMVIATTGLLRPGEIFAHKKRVSYDHTDEDSTKALWYDNIKPVFNKDQTIYNFKIKLKNKK
jgi:hypothetical protein